MPRKGNAQAACLLSVSGRTAPVLAISLAASRTIALASCGFCAVATFSSTGLEVAPANVGQ